MFNSVLVAIDGSDHARKALQIGVDLATLYDARLTILHVVTGKRVSDELRHMAEVEQLIESKDELRSEVTKISSQVGYMLSDTTLHETIARVATAVGQRTLDDAADGVRATAKIEVQAILEHGDPARQIVMCAKREGADAIIVGSRGRSNIEGVVLGSVSAKVSHVAECTCMTVK